MKLENKNINFQTISNVNTKYLDKYSKNNEKNFFYQNPLLLTKKKDMNNFYLFKNTQGEENDQYLNYSKKILNKINNQFPMMKISNIIKEMSNNKNRTYYRMKTFRKSKKEINISNSFNRRKSLTQRVKNDGLGINTNNINNTNNNKMNNNIGLKINKNFFVEKFKGLNDMPKVSEIKILKKISKDIKNKKFSSGDIKENEKNKKKSERKKIEFIFRTEEKCQK